MQQHAILHEPFVASATLSASNTDGAPMDPTIAAPNAGRATRRLIQEGYARSKYLARTDLMVWAGMHHADFWDDSSPAMEQWRGGRFGAGRCAASSGLRAGPGAAVECQGVGGSINAAKFPPALNAMELQEQAVMLHFLEQSTLAKFAQHSLSARLPASERASIHDGTLPISEVDGMGALPSLNATGCGRRVRQALFLRGMDPGWGWSELSPLQMQTMLWPPARPVAALAP